MLRALLKTSMLRNAAPGFVGAMNHFASRADGASDVPKRTRRASARQRLRHVRIKSPPLSAFYVLE
jgi:hypothetical protein